jgi:hypothetical protein
MNQSNSPFRCRRVIGRLSFPLRALPSVHARPAPSPVEIRKRFTLVDARFRYRNFTNKTPGGAPYAEFPSHTAAHRATNPKDARFERRRQSV